MTVSIQPAEASDALAISSILSNWIDETDWMPRIHTYDEDRGFGRFLLENTDVTVAKATGEVIGFVAVQGDIVQALYVAHDARRQGVGKALLDAVRVGRDYISLWTFQANADARAFYGREGFAEVEHTDGTGNDEKLPDVRLVWVRENAA